MSNFRLKIKRSVLITALTFIVFSSCSAAKDDSFVESGDSYKEILDISYTDNTSSELLKLNLIIPDNLENMPVFIWIGGGAWAYVDRNKEMDLCRQMAKEGILMVSVGHRLSPALLWEPINNEGIKHPEHIKDVALAFKWVYDNIENYNGSKENIFVGGYSSGAHLAALLAMDKRYLQNVDLSKDHIKGVIPVAGAYDIPHYRDYEVSLDSSILQTHFNPVFGETEEELIDASPIYYLDDFNTPMLLISEEYSFNFSIVLEEALHARGYDNYWSLNAHNETHNSLWMKLSNAENIIYRNNIVDFIKTHNVTKSD